MPEDTTSTTDLAAQILLVLGTDLDASRGGDDSAEMFRRCSRDQLLECARRLGLSKVTRLTKEALARRVHQAFDKLPRPAVRAADAAAKRKVTTAVTRAGSNGTHAKGGAPSADPAPDVFSSFPSKFDLGPGTEQAEPQRNIPWGYGQDRVTAMVVDPERMFVYWEVTDEAIARARRDLGRGGDGAWLNLRVYDVTGRLFDGTNAHSYFDHKVERHDRQWFFEINKPTAMNCVEVGLRSSEGFFVKIARSGRIEFPRREPVGGGHVEWLTVRTASGHAGDPVAGGAPAGVGAGGGDAGGQQPGETFLIPGWTNGQPIGGGLMQGQAQIVDRRWEWREGERGEWQSELESAAWTGPVVRTTWEAGPFTYPIEAPALVEERSLGRITTRTTNGQVHIVYGPWQVVIRGVGARAERRVLASWEVYHSWATTAGGESKGESQSDGWRQLAPGSSEWVAFGASERSWMFGSELRLGGASEIFFLGASELRLLGASETLYAGSSEYRFRGASELLYAGASERVYAGASERLYAGASERLYAGASERLYAGASERAHDYPAGVGASEAAPPRQYPERG
jgi:hypothetical protein